MATPLDTIGLSFSPSGSGQDAQQAQPQSGDLSPVQQAIKILSLRVPRNVGAGGITPNALLTSPGAGGMDIVALLRQLMQGGGPGAPTAGPASGGIPNPRVVPGGGNTPDPVSKRGPFPGSQPGPISNGGPEGSMPMPESPMPPQTPMPKPPMRGPLTRL